MNRRMKEGGREDMFRLRENVRAECSTGQNRQLCVYHRCIPWGGARGIEVLPGVEEHKCHVGRQIPVPKRVQTVRNFRELTWRKYLEIASDTIHNPSISGHYLL